MGTGESSHEQGMRRLGLEVVGRGVAVVLAAREVARLRPVARVVVLLAVEPAFQRVELLTRGRIPINLRIQRLGDGLRGPPEAFFIRGLARDAPAGGVSRLFRRWVVHRYEIWRKRAHGLSRGAASPPPSFFWLPVSA